MSQARVAVLKVVTKELSVTAAAAKYGYSRQHLHRLLVRRRGSGPAHFARAVPRIGADDHQHHHPDALRRLPGCLGVIEDLEVRAAHRADVPDLVALADALIREDAGSHDPLANLDWADEFGIDHISALVEDPDKIALLAVAGDRAVGALMGSLVPPAPFEPILIARLGRLYVEPGSRSLGAGGRLVDAFLEWAANKRADQAQVTAYAVNERAIRFYGWHGLVPHTLVMRGPAKP